MNNRTTIMIALLAIAMMIGPASADDNTPQQAGVGAQSVGTNITINVSTATSVIGTPIFITVNMTNASIFNINATPVAGLGFNVNGTGTSNGTIGPAVGSNVTFWINSSNATGYFDVNVSNSENGSEYAVLTGFKFVNSSAIGTNTTVIYNGTTSVPTSVYYFFNGSNINISVATIAKMDNVTADYSGVGGGTGFNSTGANVSGKWYYNINASATSAANTTVNLINITLTINGVPYVVVTPFVALMNFNPIYMDMGLAGSTTDWTNIDDFTSVSGLVFEKFVGGKSVGVLNLTGSVNLTDEITALALEQLGTNLKIAQHSMSINTLENALAAMNVSANLSMKNLSFSGTPAIFSRGQQVVAPGNTSGGAVSNLAYDSATKTLNFTVDHWSDYTVFGVTNTSTSAVANGTNNFTMSVVGTPNMVVRIDSNRSVDKVNGNAVPYNLTTDANGTVTFNVTSTLSGVANITATSESTTVNNTNVVFVAGPAAKLAVFGPGSVTGVTIINQTIAVQDVNGNNVTSDHLAAYRITAGIASGSAGITSTNPITVTGASASDVNTSGINYTATYELANFTITATSVGAGPVGLEFSSNVTLAGASKTVHFYGSIHNLSVTLNKTSPASMYANNGTDTVLVTVQLKDNSGGDVKTSGVTIQLGSMTPALFESADLTTNDTNADGIATFVVRSSTQSGSGAIKASVIVNPGGATGQQGYSPTIELKQAPEIASCTVVNSTNGVILTGANSTITATIKDYNITTQPIDGHSVTFNITTGNAIFADNSAKVYTTTTGSNGNATANITSTNASTSISVNVTIEDEKDVIHQVDNLQNFTVNPSAASQFAITPGRNIGLKNVNGTVKTITIRTQDSVGNFNTTAGGTINITTDNPSIGNMTNTTTTVNNNLTISISGGNATFTYTVNDTTEGTAVLTLNSSLGINDTIIITTSGAMGINLTVNKTVQDVGAEVLASAQLTDDSGTALGINGTRISFVVKNATGTFQEVFTNATDGTGIATFNFTQLVAGVYTVTASNATMSNTTSVTFAGPAASIEVTANNTAPNVNETVTINATVKDGSGVTSGSLGTGTMHFLADGAEFKEDAISDGVASTTYTTATAGAVTITAFYNGTLQGSVNVVFGEEVTLAVDTIEVTPAGPLSMNVSDDPQTFTAVCYNDTTGTTPLTGITVAWNSSNTTVGTIDPASGASTTFTALANGTTTINATAQGKSDTVTVTVGAAVEYDSADTNHDCVVSMSEMMTQIGKWKSGEVEMPEMMTSIGRWKIGTGGYC